ncbi:unnamed protein product [Gongylonema pulchrum]|uniref:I/LWEQ domain-containing protein n=1 Tax=Gongylonema pulchrum TaxID=637853 RepID=A0A183DRQ4_9BILA|nr:unnamed protein product [Gongylonema pulchrum]
MKRSLARPYQPYYSLSKILRVLYILSVILSRSKHGTERVAAAWIASLAAEAALEKAAIVAVQRMAVTIIQIQAVSEDDDMWQARSSIRCHGTMKAAIVAVQRMAVMIIQIQAVSEDDDMWQARSSIRCHGTMDFNKTSRWNVSCT